MLEYNDFSKCTVYSLLRNSASSNPLFYLMSCLSRSPYILKKKMQRRWSNSFHDEIRHFLLQLSYIEKTPAKFFVFSLSISVEWDYPVVWDNVWTLVNRENRRHHDLNQTNSLIALAIVFFIVTFVKLISLLVVSMRIIHYHCLSM